MSCLPSTEPFVCACVRACTTQLVSTRAHVYYIATALFVCNSFFTNLKIAMSAPRELLVYLSRVDANSRKKYLRIEGI